MKSRFVGQCQTLYFFNADHRVPNAVKVFHSGTDVNGPVPPGDSNDLLRIQLTQGALQQLSNKKQTEREREGGEL